MPVGRGEHRRRAGVAFARRRQHPRHQRREVGRPRPLAEADDPGGSALLGHDRREQRALRSEPLGGEERGLEQPPPDPGAAALVAEQEAPAPDHPHGAAALHAVDRAGADGGDDAVVVAERALERDEGVRLDPRRRERQPRGEPRRGLRNVRPGDAEHRPQPGKRAAAGRGERRPGRGEDARPRRLGIGPDVGRTAAPPPEDAAVAVGHRRPAAAAAPVHPEIELHPTPLCADNTKPIPNRKRKPHSPPAPSKTGQLVFFWHHDAIRGNHMTARATEAQHPDGRGLQSAPPMVALARLLDGQQSALAAVAPALPAIAAAAGRAAAVLAAGGRLAYAGAGSAGLMALADALELAGTFGIPAERTPVLFAGGAAALLAMTGAVEDDRAAAARDLAAAGLGAGDAVVCVSASGATPYTLAVAEAARAAGATVIAVANTPASPLLATASVAILLDTGPEIVAGSTRMGAGTAQKAALNLLSTLTALRLGHVHDGYMVNLVADNDKLRARAAGIVATVAGAGDAPARAALAASDGAVKPAILLAAGARDAAEAAALLAASDGHLGPALAALREPNRGRPAANRE